MSGLGLVAGPVDEVAHAQAHTAVGAWRMAEEAVASWVYLATVVDLLSRKAVGWSIGNSLATELVSIGQ